MASCENKIFKNIYASCETPIVSGIEQTIYLFNRADIQSVTKGTGTSHEKNEVTGFTLKTGKQGYVAKGLKKNLTCGFERKISDTAPDSWTNSLTLVGYEFDKLSARNIDEMGDVVAIIERKGVKSTDGTFLMLGLDNGLYVSSDTWSANENGGARPFTLSSMEEAGESFSAYILTLAETPVDGSVPSVMITTPEQIEDYLADLVPAEV